MFLQDAVSLVDAPRRTADGYLVAEARVARTGIQEYSGRELGRPDLGTVRVYRSPDEVFHVDAMTSYAFRPLTLEHPAKLVDAESWRKVAVGQTDGNVVRDGEFVRVPMVMMDAETIRAWEKGKRELSMGYTAEIVFGDGVTPDGQKYDAVQTGLRMNHLALVDRARGGAALRIGDGTTTPTEKPPMSDTNRTVMVDGLSVSTNDSGAQAIGKLIADRDARDATIASERTAHAAALAVKDADLAKRDAEIDALKAKVLTDAAIDQRVKERSDLIANARLVHDADYTGKSDADIRKAAVTAKLGDAAIAGKPEAYVAARFDILVEDAAKDPVRRTMAGAPTTRTPVGDNGWSASVAELNAGSQFGKTSGVNA